MKKTLKIGIKKLILNADDRIFKEKCTIETIIHLKKLTEYFIKQAINYKFDYDIYSNLRYIENEYNNRFSV